MKGLGMLLMQQAARPQFNRDKAGAYVAQTMTQKRRVCYERTQCSRGHL